MVTDKITTNIKRGKVYFALLVYGLVTNSQQKKICNKYYKRYFQGRFTFTYEAHSHRIVVYDCRKYYQPK